MKQVMIIMFMCLVASCGGSDTGSSTPRPNVCAGIEDPDALERCECIATKDDELCQ